MCSTAKIMRLFAKVWTWSIWVFIKSGTCLTYNSTTGLITMITIWTMWNTSQGEHPCSVRRLLELIFQQSLQLLIWYMAFPKVSFATKSMLIAFMRPRYKYKFMTNWMLAFLSIILAWEKHFHVNLLLKKKDYNEDWISNSEGFKDLWKLQ